MEMEKYYVDNGDVYKVRVENDDLYDDPRSWGNLGHMVAWGDRDWRYGDEEEVKEYRKARDFLEDMARSHTTTAQLFQFINTHETETQMSLVYRYDAENGDTWELYGKNIWYGKMECGLLEETDQGEDWLFDDAIDYMSDDDLLDLIKSNGNIVILPVHINGVCQSDWMRGYIYATKEEAIKEGYTEETWRDNATERLKGEIETYDMYFNGEVYWIGIYKLTQDEFGFAEWEDVESIGGYYSHEWDEEKLFKEVFNEAWDYDGTLYDTAREALVARRDAAA